MLGTVWPLCSITGGLCNPTVRSSYMRGRLASDLTWFTIALLAIYLLIRLGRWLS